MMKKLENIEFVGTNKLTSKISILKLFEGSRKSLFVEMKNKMMSEVKSFAEKLDAKEATTRDYEKVLIEHILSSIEMIVSIDLDNQHHDRKELKKLYTACRMVMALFPKDFDQYIVEVKTDSNKLAEFAKKNQIDPESFSSRVLLYVNQMKIGFDLSDSYEDNQTSATELKKLYEISFNPFSQKKKYYEEVDRVMKDVESRLDPRIKELN